MATTRSTINSMLLILGGVCVISGAFTLIVGDSSVWSFGPLLVGGLLLLGILSRRRTLERPSPPADPAEPTRMSAEDLMSMIPPAWEAIPPTVMMAAQPDTYFQHRRKRRHR